MLPRLVKLEPAVVADIVPPPPMYIFPPSTRKSSVICISSANTELAENTVPLALILPKTSIYPKEPVPAFAIMSPLALISPEAVTLP